MAPRPRTVPRKRPRQDRSRATIEALLTATARILRRQGFDKASTNRIAVEAGVSVGSLYQYFPSKEALVAALVERHVEEMVAELGASMARLAGAPLRVAAREMVEQMIRAHAVDPALHKVLVEQVPRIGRLDRIREVEALAIELATTYFEARRDEIRPRDLRLAAHVVVQTVEALTHTLVIDQPERLRDGGADALVDEVTELVVRYLSKDGAGPTATA